MSSSRTEFLLGLRSIEATPHVFSSPVTIRGCDGTVRLLTPLAIHRAVKVMIGARKAGGEGGIEYFVRNNGGRDLSPKRCATIFAKGATHPEKDGGSGLGSPLSRRSFSPPQGIKLTSRRAPLGTMRF